MSSEVDADREPPLSPTDGLLSVSVHLTAQLSQTLWLESRTLTLVLSLLQTKHLSRAIKYRNN